MALIINDLKNAAEIQRALLPPALRSGHFFEAAGTTSPCRVISGDYFDFFDLQSDAFGFAVCDTAGKGAAAALLSAVLQGTLRVVAHLGGGPATTLKRVNQALSRCAIDSRFATVLYGVLSNDGHLSYCNGGHNPPFLIARTGVRRLKTGGLVLGLFPHATYEEETIMLEPGDLVAIFSDGVTEAVNAAAEQFGEERLLSCVSANRTAEPAGVLKALLSTLDEFCDGATQTDDITVLIVRYAGESMGGTWVNATVTARARGLGEGDQ